MFLHFIFSPSFTNAGAVQSYSLRMPQTQYILGTEILRQSKVLITLFDTAYAARLRDRDSQTIVRAATLS